MKSIIIVILLSVISGCSTYSGIIDDLSKTDYPRSDIIYIKRWVEASPNSGISLNQAKQECISSLDQEYFRPSKVTMVLVAIKCMESKGWSLEYDHIEVMS